MWRVSPVTTAECFTALEWMPHKALTRAISSATTGKTITGWAWLDKSVNQVPPKSAIGKAIGYSLRQWPKLIRYIDYGDLNIDNNRAERAIKPFVIGRKNWMFANTANRAIAHATLYSLIETAKANGLASFD